MAAQGKLTWNCCWATLPIVGKDPIIG